MMEGSWAVAPMGAAAAASFSLIPKNVDLLKKVEQYNNGKAFSEIEFGGGQ